MRRRSRIGHINNHRLVINHVSNLDFWANLFVIILHCFFSRLPIKTRFLLICRSLSIEFVEQPELVPPPMTELQQTIKSGKAQDAKEKTMREAAARFILEAGAVDLGDDEAGDREGDGKQANQSVGQGNVREAARVEAAARAAAAAVREKAVRAASTESPAERLKRLFREKRERVGPGIELET